MSRIKYLLLTISAFVLFACEKTTNDLSLNAVGNYLPLEKGQVYHYKLDSIVFENFGQSRLVRSYDAKDEVLQVTIENSDTTYYLSRKIKSLGSNNWLPNISYTILKKKNQIQVQEDNLRYIKLMDPVNENFQWTGNSYLPYRPLRLIYEFSNDEDMQYWNYEYLNVDAPAEVEGNIYNNTITVLSIADSVNVPITIPNGIAYKNHWEEKYAFGVGLIERNVEIWEYQPSIGSQQSYRSGFGIWLRLVSVEDPE